MATKRVAKKVVAKKKPTLAELMSFAERAYDIMEGNRSDLCDEGREVLTELGQLLGKKVSNHSEIELRILIDPESIEDDDDGNFTSEGNYEVIVKYKGKEIKKADYRVDQVDWW